MTTLDDHPDLMAPPEPRPPTGARGRRCARHDWIENWDWSGGPSPYPITQCLRCNAVRDPLRSRRGRQNKRRGSEGERLAGEELDAAFGPGRAVGPLGTATDREHPLILAQIKSGGRWSAVDAADIEAQRPHARAGQVPVVVKVNRPGRGRPRRPTQIVMTLAELAGLAPGAQVVFELRDWSLLRRDET